MKKRIGSKAVTIIAIILAAVVLIIGGFALFKSFVSAPDVGSAENRKSNFYTFVLCGLDADKTRTDTIMVGAFDETNKTLNVVSIPRDTITTGDWSGRKINSAYTVGGIDQLKSELKNILGFTVDYYAVIDMDAFSAVVDEIGGVDFNVPQRMYKTSPYIDLYSGEQTLNGEQALQLVRYRDYPMGDIDRISVQQSFMKAIATQTLSIGNITKINKFAEIFKKYVDTDLSSGNLAWFASKLKALDSENIIFQTLPGDSSAYYNGVSYHSPYPNEIVELVNSVLNPYETDITVSDLDIMQIINGALSHTVSSSGSSGGSSSSSNQAATAEPATPKPTAEPTVEPTTTPSPEEEEQPSETVFIPTDEPIPSEDIPAETPTDELQPSVPPEQTEEAVAEPEQTTEVIAESTEAPSEEPSAVESAG